LRAASQSGRHLQNEPAVWLVESAEVAAELLEIVGVLAGGAPGGFVGRLPHAEFARFGRFGAVVEEQVDGDFESGGPFFQRVDGRDGVSVLDAGKISALQARAIFDLGLGQLLLLTQFAKAVADDHCEIISLM
jgi:hypothetical protein